MGARQPAKLSQARLSPRDQRGSLTDARGRSRDKRDAIFQAVLHDGSVSCTARQGYVGDGLLQ
jgi:hypothetical protein